MGRGSSDAGPRARGPDVRGPTPGDRTDDLDGVFTIDSVATTPGGVAQGRDAVIAQARRNHAPEERIQHAMSNVLVDLNGDQAQVRADVQAVFAAGTGSRPRLALGGVYRFAVRRTPVGWRLASVQMDMVWATEPPRPRQ